jgi:Na+-transporting methylmalonyl-CoA/oxaloacetate decarboxylase gamma subunit
MRERIKRWKEAWRKNLTPAERPWDLKSPAQEKAAKIQHDDTYYFMAAVVAAIHHHRHRFPKKGTKTV